jgi:hypothetical protein
MLSEKHPMLDPSYLRSSNILYHSSAHNFIKYINKRHEYFMSL